MKLGLCDKIPDLLYLQLYVLQHFLYIFNFTLKLFVKY